MIVTEIDPICALQAAMDGFAVKKMENALAEASIVVTATGNKDVINGDHFKMMNDKTIVCNIGHFDNEIDTAALREKFSWTEIKPQVHKIQRDQADADNYILLLSEGRLVNLGNATGHPSRIMDGSFANQVLAQMHLFEAKWAEKKTEPITLTVLPKKLDEEVAAEMVKGFGGVLTRLTEEQADYINVPVAGPFKSDDYKY